MKLNEIKDNFGATHSRKRVGRGIGSGLGKTSGKGHKGQKARGTGKVRIGFEGGQNPIYRRMPKRGFNNIFGDKLFPMNLGFLNYLIENKMVDVNSVVSFEVLKNNKIVTGDKYNGVSLLAKGVIGYPVKVLVNKASASAREMFEKIGGSIEIVKKVEPLKKKVYVKQ